MKFIKKLVILCTLTNTLAFNISEKKRDESDKFFEMSQYSINNANKPSPSNSNDTTISDECLKIIEDYNSCFDKLTEDNYDQVCNLYNSEHCQSLMKKRINENEPCKNVGDSTEIQYTIDVSIITMNLSCGKTEDGSYCPIAEYGKSLNDLELTDDVINETCKYKSCRYKAIESFNLYKKLNEQYLKSNMVKRKVVDMDRIYSALFMLNDEKCFSQSNDASSLKTSLLITIALFLLIFI